MEHLLTTTLISTLTLTLYYDLTQKKIPNFITFPGMVLGLISYIYLDGLAGFLFSLQGLGLGIALFFIPFAMGGMGAGDVKLMGAIGALTGTYFVLWAGIYTALWGGVIAVIILIYKGRLLKVLKNVLGMVLKPLFFFISLRFRSPFFNQLPLYFSDSSGSITGDEEKPMFFPYGVAIALGTVTALFIIGIN